MSKSNLNWLSDGSLTQWIKQAVPDGVKDIVRVEMMSQHQRLIFPDAARMRQAMWGGDPPMRRLQQPRLVVKRQHG